MNRVELFGRIASDINVTEYEKSKKETGTIAKFSLAVRRDSETADFIRCTAFGKTAELIEEYFEKGKQIGVCGRIQTGSYENKDKETIYTTEVIVSEIDFISDGSNKDDKKKRR